MTLYLFLLKPTYEDQLDLGKNNQPRIKAVNSSIKTIYKPCKAVKYA